MFFDVCKYKHLDILESIISKLFQPITWYLSDRRGHLCQSEHVCVGRIAYRYSINENYSNCLLQHDNDDNEYDLLNINFIQ